MKIWGFIAIQFALAGCVGNATGLSRSEVSAYPENWPQPIQTDFAADECASIEGMYYSSGRSNSNISEEFSNPIFEKNFFGLDEIADASNIFQIMQDDSENRLLFAFFDKHGKLLSSEHLKKFSQCESGWIVTESQVEGGSGDNPTKLQIEVTKRFLAEDGSLISNSSLTVVTSKFFIGEGTEVFDIWYRFPKTRTQLGQSQVPE